MTETRAIFSPDFRSKYAPLATFVLGSPALLASLATLAMFIAPASAAASSQTNLFFSAAAIDVLIVVALLWRNTRTKQLSLSPSRPLITILLTGILMAVAPASAQTNALSLFSESLDGEHWQTDTTMLAELAQVEGDTRWVSPQLSFDRSGMRMSGVSGVYQFTGIQSKAQFSPPFAFRTTVMGLVANGNAFGIYLVGDNLAESLRIEGNLNPRNGPYYGLSIAAGTNPGETFRRNVGVGRWYTVTVSVDANGVGNVTVTDSRGYLVGTKPDLPVGLGPFYIVLGQREGAPYTVGPNVAVWSSIELLSELATVRVRPLHEVPFDDGHPIAAGRGCTTQPSMRPWNESALCR